MDGMEVIIVETFVDRLAHIVGLDQIRSYIMTALATALPYHHYTL